MLESKDSKMVFFGAKAEAGGPMMSVFKVKLATPPEKDGFFPCKIYQSTFEEKKMG